MNIPTSTYRIQFRNGMTLDRAASLVPYLKRLGVSHLYASPIFTATSGSTHGYDVTNANEIEPAIGGRAGFDRLVNVLKHAGLGLILDIVPNHMAASLENPWWRDVVENGKKSRYAGHFDIDWSRRLTLPFLGDTFEHELEKGEITVKLDPQNGRPALVYYDCFYPLIPQSWQGRENDILHITATAEIIALHERQPWRLMSWRNASRDLSYRRFFEITGLVGMRVEQGNVFADTHRLILELVHSGAVDGLRIDHIDGLSEPKGYLKLLREQTGADCYITVEKILAENEHLPSDWPVSGTTGYEFIAALSHVMVSGKNIGTLRDAYHDVLGKKIDLQAELRAAKLLMVEQNFEGEYKRLFRMAIAIADKMSMTQDREAVRVALRELLIAFPVYRTYGTQLGLSGADLTLLHRVTDELKSGSNAPEPAALEFICTLLAGNIPVTLQSEAADFRTRFQQLTGPLMAKSVEDTLFFRQNMELALNEVGADPVTHNYSPEHFHARMKERLEHQPDGLSATSTHDTKRGEDARARLYTLTEAPQLWAACVNRWRQMNQSFLQSLNDGVAPKPSVEWMLYQSLAGAWPATLKPDDAVGIKALEGRFKHYVIKALREAKRRTSWADRNTSYESAVLDYAGHLLSPDNQPFLQDFHDALQPFILAGLVNSVTQTVVKLTAPGVPDIYQGSEAHNFSLVDPDNRREPNFSLLEKMRNIRPGFDSPLSGSELGEELKLYTVTKLLHLRKKIPALFARGHYLPLYASGTGANHTHAFARIRKSDALLVITPRLALSVFLTETSEQQRGLWRTTKIILPERLTQRRYRDVLSGKEYYLRNEIKLEIFDCVTPLILLTI